MQLAPEYSLTPPTTPRTHRDFGDVIDMSIGSKFIEEMTFHERAELFQQRTRTGRRRGPGRPRKYSPTEHQAMADNFEVISAWSIEKTCEVLLAMQLPQYCAAFKSYGIDGKQFLNLDADKLISMGFLPNHAIRLVNMISTSVAGSAAHRRQVNGLPMISEDVLTTGAQRVIPVTGGSDAKLLVDPTLAQFPPVSTDAVIAARLRAEPNTHQLQNQCSMPAMVLIYKHTPTPLYSPDARATLRLTLPAGSPLPRLFDDY